ncbi:MAG: hypothetical protein Q7R49_00045 [Candidatus Daviesbacteria bacterium]|nr:hypothetical protein [Candidatus Daviesbacteria bacterium]
MADFNRGRGGRSGGGNRGFERRGFSGGGSSGPAQMHQTTCDKCKMSCEVPFRPTSGKPVYCSNCFSSKGGPTSGWESRREDRPMFDATCDECRNRCQVPFQPTSGKPVYCSNCFGEKKNAGGDKNGDQFEVLHNKLDRILALLTPNAVDKVEEVIGEKIKVAKKKLSKKKS